MNPIELLESLMEDHGLKIEYLTEIMDLGKEIVSKTLNYQKGLSRHSIRRLADHFKLRPEAFNRPYDLKK